MQTLNRTFLPDQLTVKGKIYTRHQPNNKYNLTNQAKILEGAGIPVIMLNVLSRNLKGKTNIHGNPYQPTQWLYVSLPAEEKATTTKSPISGIESTGVTRTCIVKNLITGEELTFVNQASLTDNIINAIITGSKQTGRLLDQAHREATKQLYPIVETNSKIISNSKFAYCESKNLHAHFIN